MRLTQWAFLPAMIVALGCSQSATPPATVIFRGADGETLTTDDLRGLSGTVRYEILGKANVPAEAEALHAKAREAGAAGKFPEALKLLEQAAKLAPDWPYPVYDQAFTYLLIEDAANALRCYQKTIELSPRGFFTAVTAVDALEREARGDLPAGTYHRYLSLEWKGEPERKAVIVQSLLKEVPNFAPIWKEAANQAKDDSAKLAAIEKGLAANPDRETKGLLLINKALVQERGGDRDGAVRAIGELALDPESTYAVEHLAKTVLAVWFKR